MSADALTRRVRSTSFGLVAWEAAIVLCLAEAVTSTILGRTLIYHATLGWVLVATSIAAVTLVWLLSFWARAYPFLRSHPTTLKPPPAAYEPLDPSCRRAATSPIESSITTT